MPTYDYECTNCHHQFAGQHRIEAPKPPCPNCGAMVKKIILSAPATHGAMAQGRQSAMDSLKPQEDHTRHAHGPGCGCGH